MMGGCWQLRRHQNKLRAIPDSSLVLVSESCLMEVAAAAQSFAFVTDPVKVEQGCASHHASLEGRVSDGTRSCEGWVLL